MALNVRRGEFTRAFQDSFLDALHEDVRARPRGEETCVLVPTHLVGLHLRNRYVRKHGGIFNVRFMTFVESARGALIARGLAKPPFPAGSREIFIAQALADLPEDHPFGPVRDRRGFHRALLAQFARWVEYGANPSADLAGIREAFERAHGSKFEDEVSWIRRAASEGAAPLGSFGIFAFGFSPLTPVQREWLAVLAKDRTVEAWEHVPASCETSAATKRSFAHPTEEAAFVARDILRRHAAGEDWAAMAVILPDGQGLSIFEEIFARARIPHFRPGGKPLVETDEGWGWQKLLDLFDEPWDRRDLMEVLTTNRWIAPHGTAGDWDAWTRKAGVGGPSSQGFQKARDRLASQAATDGSSEGFSRWFGEFSRSLETLDRPFSTWTEASRAWSAFAKAHLAPTPPNQRMFEVLLGLGDMDRTGLDASASVVRRVIRARLERASMPRGGFEKGGVLLAPLAASRGLLFETLYLPGMTHDAYPRREFVPDWMKADGLPAPQEAVVAYDALLGQGASLTVTFSRADFLGKTQHPSPWIQAPIEAAAYLPWRAPDESSIDARDWMVRSLSSALLTHDRGSAAALSSLSPLFGSVGAWVEERLGQPTFGRFDGFVGRPLSRSRFSAKHIADFSTCAYQYFLRNFASLSRSDSPEDEVEVDRMERGNLIHRILFRLFTALSKEGRFPLRKQDAAAVFDRLRAIADETFASASKAVGLENLWEHEKGAILQDLRAFLRAEFDAAGPLVPEAFEVRFGMKARDEHEDARYSTPVPVSYDAGGETVELYGKIDRVDLSPDRTVLRVVDYKTGVRVRTRDDAFEGGRSVQLPIYLLAARALFGGLDLDRCEATLLSTSYAGGFDRASFSGRVLLAREAEFQRILSVFRSYHERGLFPPNPGKNRSNCETCEFVPICGRAIERVVERKKADPAARPYFSLEEIP